MLACSLLVFVAMLCCYTRAAFAAFLFLAVLFAIVRYRRLLLLLPALPVLAFALPNVHARILTGLESTKVNGERDWDDISAGRTDTIWPPAIAEAVKQPLLGRGRLSFLRSPAREAVAATMGECPTHPHCAYLEMLLDAGVAGLFVTLLFHLSFLRVAFTLYRRNTAPVITVIASFAIAYSVTFLLMGLTGQSFFPKENHFAFLCILGLLLRAERLASQHRYFRYAATS